MEVKFHTTFKKKLKKVPPKIQERFYEQLELFAQDKFNSVPPSCPLLPAKKWNQIRPIETEKNRSQQPAG